MSKNNDFHKTLKGLRSEMIKTRIHGIANSVDVSNKIKGLKKKIAQLFTEHRSSNG